MKDRRIKTNCGLVVLLALIRGFLAGVFLASGLSSSELSKSCGLEVLALVIEALRGGTMRVEFNFLILGSLTCLIGSFWMGTSSSDNSDSTSAWGGAGLGAWLESLFVVRVVTLLEPSIEPVDGRPRFFELSAGLVLWMVLALTRGTSSSLSDPWFCKHDGWDGLTLAAMGSSSESESVSVLVTGWSVDLLRLAYVGCIICDQLWGILQQAICPSEMSYRWNVFVGGGFGNDTLDRFAIGDDEFGSMNGHEKKRLERWERGGLMKVKGEDRGTKERGEFNRGVEKWGRLSKGDAAGGWCKMIEGRLIEWEVKKLIMDSVLEWYDLIVEVRVNEVEVGWVKEV